MGSNLTSRSDTPTDHDHAVILDNPDSASGLADMLHQFLTQTLECPKKRRKARRLRGDLLFCAAEDPTIRVCISFSPDRIQLCDAGDSPIRGPQITADFISTAHLTTGEANPFSLLVRRKITARFRLGQTGFLLGFLGLMRIPPDEPQRHANRHTQVLSLVLGAAACAAAVYFALNR